ncbi:MAG: hypothetical protein AAB504_00605 [Patescibacteria group bacterium]
MKKYQIATKIKDVFTSGQVAHKRISELKPKEKASLEKEWDIEHAYYSSSLEGSKVDKREFEKMAKNIE